MVLYSMNVLLMTFISKDSLVCLWDVRHTVSVRLSSVFVSSSSLCELLTSIFSLSLLRSIALLCSRLSAVKASLLWVWERVRLLSISPVLCRRLCFTWCSLTVSADPRTPHQTCDLDIASTVLYTYSSLFISTI